MMGMTGMVRMVRMIRMIRITVTRFDVLPWARSTVTVEPCRVLVASATLAGAQS